MEGMLNELNFKFKSENPVDVVLPKHHYGVVGSGDLEVLLKKHELEGAVEIRVVSPVRGFDHVWEKVLEKVISDAEVGNVAIEINDNNATPVVVALRLAQALSEAKSAEQSVN
ncbi:malonate decarboxylase delta subunit [Malonomonas rubra DSM 5091]|uniref:Malonate decarboxylase acyl carrier protein n=2 Tax=Malonomonas rubra TaxID=57040 RepID=MDCC_MALRU|nr:malonate decarboxylase acyl carrier protein [Malonomonas rubra]O06925.1 RecName: Full=Malonate decarboxylase acyl carrier protein; AltName: Full=Malonate decarboxylase subunit delta [Malonomonas rubra]AAC45401.1 acyl carrier protein [Malonomonas rubra]SHJ97778.1 malonate decarboxylase delta subunit [Malonomonas rubra DSM 5091]